MDNKEITSEKHNNNYISRIKYDRQKIIGNKSQIELIQSSDYDSKLRKVKLEIKENKYWLGYIKNWGVVLGLGLSFFAVIWAIFVLTYSVLNYTETLKLFTQLHEPLILWMYGLSVCSLMALIVTLCLTLTRIFSKRPPKIKAQTTLMALLEELRKTHQK